MDSLAPRVSIVVNAGIQKKHSCLSDLSILAGGVGGGGGGGGGGQFQLYGEIDACRPLNSHDPTVKLTISTLVSW